MKKLQDPRLSAAGTIGSNVYNDHSVIVAPTVDNLNHPLDSRRCEMRRQGGPDQAIKLDVDRPEIASEEVDCGSAKIWREGGVSRGKPCLL